MLAAGDGRTVLQEYRGYILDGGGHDWAGNNPHPGGHARLNPAYKELLIEVDAMEGVTHMPKAPVGIISTVRAGIASWMDIVAIGMSQAVDGAGIRLFYVIHDTATPYDTFNDPGVSLKDQITAYHASQRHPYMTSFTHLQLAGEFHNSTAAGFGWPGVGAIFAVDTGFDTANFLDVPHAAFSPHIISHELHHVITGTGHYSDTTGNAVAGEVDDQYRVLWDYRYVYPTKILDATISSTDTVIPLSDTDNLTSPGIVRMQNGESISYNGIAGSSLIDAVRGQRNSTASSHPAGATVQPRYYGRDARQIMYGQGTVQDSNVALAIPPQ